MSIEHVITALVGSTFCIYGLNELIATLQWRRAAHRVSGYLYAVEKYSSQSRDNDGHTHTSVFYRALVKYPWQDSQRLVKGVGQGSLDYEIGKTVNVLVRVDATTGAVRARIENGSYFVVALVFSLMGAATLVGFYWHLLGGNLWIPVAFIMLAVIALRMAAASSLSRRVKHGEDDQQISESSLIMDTPEKLAAEKRVYNKVAHWVQAVFLVISLGILYLGLSGMPESLMDTVKTAGLVDGIRNDSFSDKEINSLILIGFGSFFLLACMFSFLQTLRKR